MGGTTAKTFFTLSLSSNLFSSRFSLAKRFPLLRPPKPTSLFLGFRPLCTAATETHATIDDPSDQAIQPMKHFILLQRLRVRHLNDSAAAAMPNADPDAKARPLAKKGQSEKKMKRVGFESFEELGLSEEAMAAVRGWPAGELQKRERTVKVNGVNDRRNCKRFKGQGLICQL